jgi:hypothetical protein
MSVRRSGKTKFPGCRFTSAPPSGRAWRCAFSSHLNDLTRRGRRAHCHRLHRRTRRRQDGGATFSTISAIVERPIRWCINSIQSDRRSMFWHNRRQVCIASNGRCYRQTAGVLLIVGDHDVENSHREANSSWRCCWRDVACSGACFAALVTGDRTLGIVR